MMRKRRQRMTIEPRAYTKMLRAIDSERKRHRWLYVAAILALLGAGIVFVIARSIAQPWWSAAIAAVNVGWIVFISTLLMVLGNEVLYHGDNVDKAIEVGLQFLREANYGKPVLDCIKERAQTAGTAATLRTILPAVAVPIALGILLAQDFIPSDIATLGWGIAAIFIGNMFVELLRGSTAYLILDALAEFRCEQEVAHMEVNWKTVQIEGAR